MIEEIPINSEINEINEINAEPVVGEAVEAEPEEPAPAPKKRGRPFGATGKAKAKPKAAPKAAEAAPKVAAKTKKKPRVVEVSSESEEEIIVKKKTRRPTPEPEARIPTTQDVAAEIMHMLSNRHVDRATQRRAKYDSWFH